MYPVIVAGLILSLAVRYWPGQPSPQWIVTWTDRLWMLLGMTFLAGTALSFFNITGTPLPNGGILYSTTRPQPIQYALIVIWGSLAVLALAGAGYVVRASASALEPARIREGWGRAAAGVHFRRLAGSLAVAAVALAVGLTLGEPLTIGTREGVAGPWGFAIEAVAAIVFFTALASAWSAARPFSRPD
jgi:hypothetical protein